MGTKGLKKSRDIETIGKTRIHSIHTMDNNAVGPLIDMLIKAISMGDPVEKIGNWFTPILL